MSEKGRLHRGKSAPEQSAATDAVEFADIFPDLPAEAQYSGEPPIPDERAVRREREAAKELRQSAWWKAQLALGICHYCGRHFPPEKLTMDHVVPVSRGGRSIRGNVVPCCKSCNNRKKYLLPSELSSPNPASAHE